MTAFSTQRNTKKKRKNIVTNPMRVFGGKLLTFIFSNFFISIFVSSFITSIRSHFTAAITYQLLNFVEFISNAIFPFTHAYDSKKWLLEVENRLTKADSARCEKQDWQTYGQRTKHNAKEKKMRGEIRETKWQTPSLYSCVLGQKKCVKQWSEE